MYMCKECYFDCLVIVFAMFITMGTLSKVQILYSARYNTESRSCLDIFKLMLRCSEQAGIPLNQNNLQML